MSKHQTAAERAARTLSLYIPTEGSWCEDGELSPDETRIIELVQTAIKESTAEKDARIEQLEVALTRATRALRFADTPEGVVVEYSSLADQLDAVLTPLE